MSRQQLFAAFFLVVLCFLLYQLYQILQIFLVPLTWAALLALIFYPVQAELTRRLGGRNGLAAFIFTTVVILVVMVPTVFVSILLANESVALYQRTTEFLSGDGPGLLLARIEHLVPQRVLDAVRSLLAGGTIDVAALVRSGTSAASGFLVSQAAGVAKNVAQFVANFFLTTVALFFFFRDGARMVRVVRDSLPMERVHKDELLGRLYETVSAVVQGSLVTAAAQGLLAGVGYWALGVPFSLVFGCATALMSLVPMGPPLVWGGVAAYLFVTGAVLRGVLLVVWGVLAVGTVDNFLRPLIIGGRTEIPTVLLFFGILGGLNAYGFIGVFLAPVVIAILVATVRIYRDQYSTAG